MVRDLCTNSHAKRHSLWVQVDFVPASKPGQGGRQQPEEAEPASDKHNNTDGSHGSPHSHRGKRKRDRESDLRDADSRPEHRRAHRREEEERTRDQRTDKHDRGCKGSRRRHESRDGRRSDDQDDERDAQRRSRRSSSHDNKSEEEAEVPADTGDAAAQDSR